MIVDPTVCSIAGESVAAGADTHFSVYHELMARKVQDILLVASAYDAYILEEDGSLASKIIHEYSGLNLSRPPRLTKVSTAAEALSAVTEKPFDLVLTMPHLGDMDSVELCREVKTARPGTPVYLLLHDIRGPLTEAKTGASGGIDRSFAWTGDADLLLALVKNTEDWMNVDTDTKKAGVRVLLLVEDSPLYRSLLLPVIYREVVRQTQAILEEGLNEEHRLLKMRARPKILVAERFEDALSLFRKYRDYVFGVLSDTRFPRGSRICDDAGIVLLKEIKEAVPYLPMLLLSNQPENRSRAAEIPAVFVDKNSPRLVKEIHAFFLEFLGFGDFVFRNSDGKEIGRAATFQALEELLPSIPDEPVLYQALRNRFSNWFMARSEISLASKLATVHASEFSDVPEMKRYLVENIRSLRRQRQKGVVTQFLGEEFDPDITEFAKIGWGSLGGKGRGLAFLSHLLRQHNETLCRFPSVDISIPHTLVVSTDAFETFMRENDLEPGEAENCSDEEFARQFQAAALPAPLRSDLRAFLHHMPHPLSVRSSSLMEDAHFNPFTGLYKTYMLPNNHARFETRLDHLETAVKLVYASTFFTGPQRFSRSTAQQFRQDRMAVIIQRLAGGRHGDYFYPCISGVAQSHNFYPVKPALAEDGAARIVLGMGKSLEEGDSALRFCPRYPENLPQFSKLEDILENAQRSFYALPMSGYNDALYFDRGTNLEKRDVEEAAGEYPVQMLCSRYLPEEHRLRDTLSGAGYPLVTFAQVLKYDRFPLASLLSDLLVICQEGMGCPVEFEFSVSLDPAGKMDRFSILQIRPMAAGEERLDVRILPSDRENAFCFSSRCLGNGRLSHIADIVFIDPDTFDPARTPEAAVELSAANRMLNAEKRAYLLVGPGRWGSFDRWLGIPVKWEDISGVGAMVELRTAALKADPSYGSHFFQKITSRGIPYATVTEGEGADFFDWGWLRSVPEVRRGRYYRHVRLARPFVIKTDGKNARCVMRKPTGKAEHRQM